MDPPSNSWEGLGTGIPKHIIEGSNPSAFTRQIMKKPLSKEDLLLIREDITCGFHSGFPPCCIHFFIFKWWPNILSKRMRILSKRMREHWKAIRRVRKYDIQYIPCPQCLKDRNIVEVKKCPKNCTKKKLVAKLYKKSK